MDTISDIQNAQNVFALDDVAPHGVLPFQELGISDFGQVSQGPRISSMQSNPQHHYGPVTIRNYLAGYAKKTLRIARSKGAPEWGDLFLQLPIEIKLLVLEQLHPIDLYHLSLISKRFRSFVLDPKASGVWKTSFESHPDLPKPPTSAKHSSWAHMLYGPGICGECGRLGALTDFAFRKRFCGPCMKSHYRYVNDLRDTKNVAVLPDNLVCSLVPRSYRYHGLRYISSYHSPANAQYLRADFDAMMKKVTIIQLVLQRDWEEVFELAQLFYEYRNALMDHVTEVNDCADAANSWAMDVFRKCSIHCDIAAGENTKRCKTRLRNLGHDMADIEYVQFSITHAIRQEHVHKLTPRAFRKIRPRLESVVTNRKIDRLKKERRDLIESIYINYLKSLDPDRWQYLPPACLVKDFAGFSEFLTAPFVTRGDLSTEYAVRIFPEFTAAWMRQTQENIAALLPDAEPGEDFDAKLKRLELAKNVITCSDCKLKQQSGRALVGWANICRHACNIASGNHRPCDQFEINEQASAAAVSLISCVGLDPASATVEQMCERGDRFICGNCMSETSRGITGLKTFNWIECIVHVVEMEQSRVVHEPLAWFLLTPEATTFVKEHEHSHPCASQRVWRCNKCATHYSLLREQHSVIEHMKTVHLIQNPILDVDLVADRRVSIRRRKPFRLGLDPAYEFSCMKCPKMGIHKLWEFQALKKHLIGHQILDPMEGIDWIKVEIIAAAYPPTPMPELESVPSEQVHQ